MNQGAFFYGGRSERFTVGYLPRGVVTLDEVTLVFCRANQRTGGHQRRQGGRRLGDEGSGEGKGGQWRGRSVDWGLPWRAQRLPLPRR